MASEAEPQAGGTADPQTQSISEQPQGSLTESPGTVAASHDLLGNIGSAWFFEAAPDAMVLVDRHGRIALVNSQTEKTFGYAREELIGESVEKLMPERFRNGHLKHRSQYSANPHTRPMGAGLELFGQRRDGQEFPIEISLAPLETEDGVLISTAIRDVTDLKRTKELHSSLEFEKLMSRLSKIFVNLPVKCLDIELNNGLKAFAEIMDLDRIVLALTDPTREIGSSTYWWARAGVPAPPLRGGRELFPYLTSRIAKGDIYCVSQPADLPEEAVAEREHMLSQGMKSWLATPFIAGGKQLGLMSSALFHRQQTWDSRTVTRFQQAGDLFASVLARGRAEKAQSESEERFRTVANTAPALIRMSGTDKVCTFFNKSWLAFVGHTVEEEQARGWSAEIHPEDLDCCLEMYSAEFDARSEVTLEYRLRRHDGDYRWIMDRAVPRFDSDGRFLGYIDSCLDITDRKLSEQALTDQLKFQTMLGELLTAFISLTPGRLDSQIKEVQKRICETLGLDRSMLAQLPIEGDDLMVTHSWAAEGFSVAGPLSRRHLPWMVRMMMSGQPIKIARIDDLPEDAAIDKETLRQSGLKSSMVFPLLAGGKTIGALAFTALQSEREWPDSLVAWLGITAQVFANVLARAQTDENLRQAFNQIEELKQRLEKENVYLREEVNLEHHHKEIIGDSPAIRRVLKKVEQVAPTGSTVLVLGETGTGKELIARAIHDQSRRRDRVMVKVNCAVLPPSLIESELFGREKGAFTGALTRGMGRFELAHDSTILLDEVGELPVDLQSKLLRVLQEGEFERLGSPKTIKIDVRVIAATSRDLQQAVRDGKFREDLFFRLNVFPITIPPLRERREDIPPLVWHFVNELSQRMGRSIESIQGSTMEAFKSYHWPGNVRELRNVIERFLITSTNTMLRGTLPTVETAAVSAPGQTFEEVERNHILRVMDMVGWRVRGEGGAAQVLKMKPTTLESRMQKLGISRQK